MNFNVKPKCQITLHNKELSFFILYNSFPVKGWKPWNKKLFMHDYSRNGGVSYCQVKFWIAYIKGKILFLLLVWELMFNFGFFWMSSADSLSGLHKLRNFLYLRAVYFMSCVSMFGMHFSSTSVFKWFLF